MRRLLMLLVGGVAGQGWGQASQCRVVNDRCGFGLDGTPVEVPGFHGEGPMGDADAHICCDGLLCEDNVCRRPYGSLAPTAEDLKALFDQHVPEREVTLEDAAARLAKWQGREERLFTSLRLKWTSSAKHEL